MLNVECTRWEMITPIKAMGGKLEGGEIVHVCIYYI